MLAAALGIGVHVFSGPGGLVANDADGWSYLPPWLARPTGATALLLGSIVLLGILGAAIAIVARQSGLSA